MAAIDARVKRKRARLWTVVALADHLGVDPSTIHRLEARPIPPLLADYLRAVGYRVTFNPKRKDKA